MMASISTVSTVSVTEQQYPVLYHADYTIYSIFRLLTSTCGTSPPMVEYFSVLSGDDKTPGIEKGNPPRRRGEDSVEADQRRMVG